MKKKKRKGMVGLANAGMGFTQIRIDLDKLKQNYQTALTLIRPGTALTCVLKANAYGHGAWVVGQTLQKVGCQSFAVSSAREALELRRHGITGELIVMGVAEGAYIPALCRENVILTIASLDEARAVSAPADVQFKVDTGFHRLGFSADERGINEILEAAALPNIRPTGLYSHLGLVDAAHDSAQHDRLIRVHTALKERGLLLKDVHLCDSIGMVRYPAYHHTRVRVGAFLYGVRPMGSEQMAFECLETLALVSTVTRVHLAKKGDYVGYDDTAPLKRDTLIATIQAGYGDGYPRRMAKKAGVLVRGAYAPLLSLVCMDQMMADVTDVPHVAVGDEVTLLGSGIPYMTYADWAQTNRNEALASLSRRPQRVYMQNGAPVMVVDALTEEIDGQLE